MTCGHISSKKKEKKNIPRYPIEPKGKNKVFFEVYPNKVVIMVHNKKHKKFLNQEARIQKVSYNMNQGGKKSKGKSQKFRWHGVEKGKVEIER